VQRQFDSDDSWHLGAGTHCRLWEVLGAHPDDEGTSFGVWAPNATAVSVIGDQNGWTHGVDVLAPDPSGVWRGRADTFGPGDRYKYSITAPGVGATLEKADPVGFMAEEPPATASVVWQGSYRWSDEDWMARRGSLQRFDTPVSIYEVHLGSWRFEPGGYRALADQLADYCVDMGFTHVELMPVMEHPFYGSWGYQTTGYFAPSRRYGTPDDLKAMIDRLHQAGVGVILDWVPSHFPVDAHGLGDFDGTHLYEHADSRQGFHPDWKSYVFNYGRPEVRSFLLSSAHYWLDQFHADGIRVDAVASMLYLDYSRADGEWIPNAHGGNENLGAIEFMTELNRSAYREHSDVLMIAEESTAWPGVSTPVDQGGLGYGFKWDMGWMNDSLAYFSQDPLFRKWHHDRLTFRTVYASSEHYVLPLSHDEVVHGKGSLLSQMPGDRWQQFANLRLLLAYQWTAPGKKLLFMGGELAQVAEWNHESELDWALLSDPLHAGMQRWVRTLNTVYRQLRSLSQLDRDPSGFQWVVADDSDQSVLVFLRHAPGYPSSLVALNLTPNGRSDYRIGVPQAGAWMLKANSDDESYAGSGVDPGSEAITEAVASHGHNQSVVLNLPPLGAVIYSLAD